MQVFGLQKKEKKTLDYSHEEPQAFFKVIKGGDLKLKPLLKRPLGQESPSSLRNAMQKTRRIAAFPRMARS